MPEGDNPYPSKSHNMVHKLAIILVIASFLAGCSDIPEPSYDFDALLNAYGEVWNSGDVSSLDTLVSKDFDYRYNSSGPHTGLSPLISSIESSRDPFTDFSLVLKDKSEVSDTVCLITWEITGNRKTDGEPFNSVGFSVIFHSEGLITGEWISFSDMDWVTGLGYRVSPPE